MSTGLAFAAAVSVIEALEERVWQRDQLPREGQSPVIVVERQQRCCDRLGRARVPRRHRHANISPSCNEDATELMVPTTRVVARPPAAQDASASHRQTG